MRVIFIIISYQLILDDADKTFCNALFISSDFFRSVKLSTLLKDAEGFVDSLRSTNFSSFSAVFNK